MMLRRTLFLIILLAPGCANSGLTGQKKKDRSDDAKDPKPILSESERLGSEKSGEAGTAGDDDLSDQPVMITGTYLTCTPLTEEIGGAATDCTLMSGNPPQPVDLHRIAPGHTWKVATTPSAPAETAPWPPGSGGPHVHISFPGVTVQDVIKVASSVVISLSAGSNPQVVLQGLLRWVLSEVLGSGAGNNPSAGNNPGPDVPPATNTIPPATTTQPSNSTQQTTPSTTQQQSGQPQMQSQTTQDAPGPDLNVRMTSGTQSQQGASEFSVDFPAGLQDQVKNARIRQIPRSVASPKVTDVGGGGVQIDLPAQEVEISFTYEAKQCIALVTIDTQIPDGSVPTKCEE